MTRNALAVRTAAVLSMIAISSGGARSLPELQAVHFPSPAEAGDLMREVPAPALRKGMDARLLAAETRKALVEANGRIRGGCEWYDEIRRHYDPATDAHQCDKPPVPSR
ncbi:MAG: hypothetical protein MEQ84_08730 [Mesorhizobium sp.]|nr:hypothetical protein [Mesorhizobium sp.]